MKLLLLFALSLAAFAADISGNWKGSAEGPNGAIERTFVFKQEGAKFTGETVSSFVGKSEISDGKVDGDNLTFSIKAKFQDNEMTLSYKGKVISADELKLTSEFNGQGIEWKVTRVK